jgi:predicted secreted protein
MGWATGIAVYVTIWWVVLFAVLPWGVERSEDLPPGADRGAPARPRLLLKAGVTSLVAAILWAALYAVVESGVFSFRPAP